MGLTAIFKTGAKLVDHLFASKEERAQAELEERKLDLEQSRQQTEIDTQEARSRSVFVAGWRPFIGWICAIGLAWKFILFGFVHMILSLAGQDPSILPVPDTNDMMTLVLGMLGLGGMRSYEKLRGVHKDG